MNMSYYYRGREKEQGSVELVSMGKRNDLDAISYGIVVCIPDPRDSEASAPQRPHQKSTRYLRR